MKANEREECDRGMQQERYGLRPDELDADGCHTGELHGDGRHNPTVEFP